MIKTFFTFGQNNSTSFDLPDGHRIADYWVEVHLPAHSRLRARPLFIEHFTTPYCPRPEQFGFQYYEDEFEERFFPCGCLCVINEEGIVGLS